MEDIIAWADIIGTIAGILVLSSFVPASGMFLWVIYGLIRSDPVIIGTNAAGFALNLTLLAMKVRYDKSQKGYHKNIINCGLTTLVSYLCESNFW